MAPTSALTSTPTPTTPPLDVFPSVVWLRHRCGSALVILVGRFGTCKGTVATPTFVVIIFHPSRSLRRSSRHRSRRLRAQTIVGSAVCYIQLMPMSREFRSARCQPLEAGGVELFNLHTAASARGRHFPPKTAGQFLPR